LPPIERGAARQGGIHTYIYIYIYMYNMYMYMYIYPSCMATEAERSRAGGAVGDALRRHHFPGLFHIFSLYYLTL